MTGEELLDFLEHRMTMSSYYQPLVIRELAVAGGVCPRDDLARALLLEDRFALESAVKTLMRWPKITLEKHGIVSYRRREREFDLLVDFEDDAIRDQVIEGCDLRVRWWQQKEAIKVASTFFGVIEAAGGRCQACGVPGSIRPLDVDHIVPRSHARGGVVITFDGEPVPMDDRRNLQALCTRCNRGKRDTSTYDFRPSKERLAETIRLVLENAQGLGYGQAEILALAASDR
jgi:5-methylcytosine-specific restriction endonuclease McrA